MEEGANHVEPLGLIRLDHDRDHLPVQIHVRVIGCDDLFELLKTLFAVKEFAAGGNVVTKVLIGQPQFIEYHGGPVGTEGAAVETDIEQPVVFVVRFFCRCINEIAPLGIVLLQADFCFKCPNLIQSEDVDAFGKVEQGQGDGKLLIRVVPEDDPVPFFVKQAGQGVFDLRVVHFFNHE